MGSWAGVVEYEAYVFGLASIVIRVVDGRGDAEPSVGSIFDERWPRVRVSCRVVDDFLIRPCYHYWGCGRSDALR